MMGNLQAASVIACGRNINGSIVCLAACLWKVNPACLYITSLRTKLYRLNIYAVLLATILLPSIVFSQLLSFYLV